MKCKLCCLLLVFCLLLTLKVPTYAADYSTLITGVLDDMSSNNAQCSGAPQQEANGAYRMVEMLAIIALELDTSGTCSSLITNILDDMSSNNAQCSGAPQQLANGLYRCVEMAAVIALINQ